MYVYIHTYIHTYIQMHWQDICFVLPLSEAEPPSSRARVNSNSNNKVLQLIKTDNSNSNIM